MPTTRPKVHVVATGGSISGIGPDRLDYLLYPELGQGFLGYVDSEGQAVFYRDVTRRHTTQTPFDVRGRETLPRVDIVYTYSGADGLLIDAVRQHGSEGLIVVGFGSGSLSSAIFQAGAEAIQDGIAVVIASRATSGRVIMTPQKEAHGYLVADDLLPQKARILLMLGLCHTRDRQELQEMFYRY
jgi:L-asparaginase